MARVLFSDQARQSLLEILTWIAEDNPSAALQLVDDIERRLTDILSHFPEAGPSTGGGRRFFTIRRHVAVYRYDPGTEDVVVLDVFGPGMNWRL